MKSCYILYLIIPLPYIAYGFSGCRIPYTVIAYKEATREFASGNFSQASKLVENIRPDILYERLLDNANIAIFHSAAKNYKLSNFFFEYVVNLAEDVEPITIKEVGGSLITNEENFYYRLEDTERILIHFLMALNYLAMQLPQDALVEFRRVEKLLNKFSQLRQTKYPIIEAFRFLAAYCYFLNRDYEDSKIELKKIKRNELFKSFRSNKQLLLIVSSGIAPKKVPDPDFPFFPKYVDNFYEYSQYSVILDGQKLQPLYIIDISKILKIGLYKRLKYIKTKTLARLALKTGATILITEKKPLLGILSGLTLFGWEKPDTRSIQALPDKINIYYLSDDSNNKKAKTLLIFGDKKYQRGIKLLERMIFEKEKELNIIIERLPF